MEETAIYKTKDFSQQYFLLREKEGRIYSDEQLRTLPEINDQHPHYQEWLLRENSSSQLVKFLHKKGRPLEILEVGCGNGWLSAKLSGIPLWRVTGIDINTAELNQAKRVFSGIENLEFLHCSLNDEIIRHRRFDIIVFAASIQYFSSLKNILSDALNFVKPDGEVHILDSHFYDEKEIDSARQRTIDYYRTIGFPEMSHQYFHHSLEGIKLFNYNIFYDPHSFINRIKRNKNPFYWICVKANA